jgi:hypothetical protein
MITKTFDSWDIDEIERTFGLDRVRHSPTFDAWMNAPQQVLTESEREFVEVLREELADAVDLWNEDELKFRFIAPFVSLVRYNTEKFRVFTQRPLTAIIGDIELTGRVDFVIATGKAKPIMPFFFLHEYKKEFAGNSSPRAQLLAEMIAARSLNATRHPIYGCYVVGRNWFFVVLEGNEYTESLEYSAVQDDIFTILAILREARAIIGRLAEKYV